MTRLLFLPYDKEPTMRIQDSAAASLVQSAPAQLAVGGVTAVATAIWHSLTGTLAVVMVGLFICDIVLGVLKALNVGGFQAFCVDRFQRGLTKFGAALVGVVLSALADILLRNMGVVSDGSFMTSGLLGFLCLGFLVSAGRNLAHFFPWVEVWFNSMLRKVRNPDEPPQRRAADRAEAAES